MITFQTQRSATRPDKVFLYVFTILCCLMSTACYSDSSSANSNSPSLVKYARSQIGITTYYDPAYVKLSYPNGDVPIERGVCTDVVIRAYRKQGKDLQKLVHNDMKKAWSAYPKIWGLKSTDRNIDHRRVPNLQIFFQRHGKKLAITKNPTNYKAGDLVTWSVSGRPHIGIVSDKKTFRGIPKIIHNIGLGTQENDILFQYKITGHYRYR